MGNRLKSFKLLPLVVLALEGSCFQVPPLRPYAERTDKIDWLAPFIVVGVAEGDKVIGRPLPSPVSSESRLQLHRVTVHVENVLRGAIPAHTITVYYFTDERLKGGLGPPRRILWLRKDSGVYRMDRDGPKSTIVVLSGAHPGYKPDPNAPILQTLDDILLSRGEGPVDNDRFAREIDRGGLDDGTLAGYIIEKLRHLALTESSEVKFAACRELWGYSGDKIADSLRERARDSVRAAGCTCVYMGRKLVCH